MKISGSGLVALFMCFALIIIMGQVFGSTLVIFLGSWGFASLLILLLQLVAIGKAPSRRDRIVIEASIPSLTSITRIARNRIRRIRRIWR